MKRLQNVARIANIAMSVMIAALLLSFFVKSRWITIIWIAAAIVCVICLLLAAYQKNR